MTSEGGDPTATRGVSTPIGDERLVEAVRLMRSLERVGLPRKLYRLRRRNGVRVLARCLPRIPREVSRDRPAVRTSRRRRCSKRPIRSSWSDMFSAMDMRSTSSSSATKGVSTPTSCAEHARPIAPATSTRISSCGSTASVHGSIPARASSPGSSRSRATSTSTTCAGAAAPRNRPEIRPRIGSRTAARSGRRSRALRRIESWPACRPSKRPSSWQQKSAGSITRKSRKSSARRSPPSNRWLLGRYAGSARSTQVADRGTCAGARGRRP